jgi:hypothetical protein
MMLTDSQSATDVLVLTDDEDQLVWEIENWLDNKNNADAELVRERFQCLHELGAAISRYPSVRDTQLLHGEPRDEEKLIKSLCDFSTASHLLHIPTKVVAIRSFLVAKFHAFSLLSYLVRESHEFYIPLKKIIFSIICTLMAEDVYFSCLEDEFLPHNTKLRLTRDLISLWDSGTDTRAIRHLPALINLWTARDEAPPVFGTMDGTSELLRISIDMGEDWRDFLIEEAINDETRWALEEFLFGLSYEEIVQIRLRLARFGVTAIGYDEIRSYLGSKPSYSLVKGDNPRGIYDFFVDRREAGLFRKRISSPGPRRTLEEIYLKYRIVLELK